MQANNFEMANLVNQELDAKDHISIDWYAEDVISVNPKLTHIEEMKVLRYAHDEHDANYGASWDAIEDMIKTNHTTTNLKPRLTKLLSNIGMLLYTKALSAKSEMLALVVK